MELNIPLDEVFRLTSKGKHPSKCQVFRCKANKANTGNLCHKHKMRLWRIRNPIASGFCKLRDRAKRRGIPFEITLPEYRQIVLSSGYLVRSGSFIGCLQLDRIDAKKGYTLGNLQVLTVSENAAKGNRERMSHEYKRALLLRRGYEDIGPYCDWVDPDSVSFVEAANGDPF